MHVVQTGNYRFCTFPLLIGGIKNSAPVLRANIWPLAVTLRRVVQAEKMLQQRFDCKYRWVIAYPHNFSMAGIPITDIFIRRIRRMTAAVAGRRLNHAGNLIQIKLHAPETAGGQDDLLVMM